MRYTPSTDVSLSGSRLFVLYESGENVDVVMSEIILVVSYWRHVPKGFTQVHRVALVPCGLDSIRIVGEEQWAFEYPSLLLSNV